MVEELKLAIKVDDDAIEQTLLKQFANAEKMANKVVLTFNNIDLDNKAIEAKFKEMQKIAGKNPIDLSIDKSSIEMLSAISKQLGNIFDIAKGKSIIDSSALVSDVNKITQSTNQQIKAVEKVTSSYKNQAYELASILKMLAKFDQYGDAPYAENLSKVVKSSASSFKEGNSIQFAALKNGFTEEMLKYLRGFSVNLSGAFNYAENLGLDSATISDVGVLVKYFRELLKEKVAFNNAKLNMSDIEELIKALGILKKEHIDDGTKSGRNVYGDAYLDKYSNLDMIKDYLKEQEKQAVVTAQAEQKLADAEKEVGKSSIPESQNKIQEELKETQKQAKQTSEALSNIADGNKSNILSGTLTQEFDNSMQQDLVMLENYKNTIKEIDALKLEPETEETKAKIEELNKLADYFVSKISVIRSENGGYVSQSIMKFSGQWNETLKKYPDNARNELYKLVSEKSGLQMGSVSTEFIGIEKEISNIESKSESLRLSLTKSMQDSIKYVKELKHAFTTLAASQDELKTEKNPKWIEGFNSDINKALSKFPELIQFKDKFTEDQALQFVKTDEWNKFLSTLPQAKEYLKSIGYSFEEIKESSASPLKDVFQGDAEKSGMNAVATATEEAVQAKKDFSTANEGVQSSVDGSKSKLELEAELMESIAKNAREAADAKREFVKANNEVKDSTENSNGSLKNDKYKNRSKVSEDDYYNSEKYASIANQRLTDNGNVILGNSVSTELVDGFVKVNAKIKTVDGTWKTFSAKIDGDGKMFEQRFRTITKNVNKLNSELENFGKDSVESVENTKKKLDDVVFKPNTEGFDDIIVKFKLLQSEAEQIVKIIKETKQTADGMNVSYKATLKNGSSYYLGESSNPQVLRASEVAYNAKTDKEEWDKNIKAIQDYMDAVTKLNNLKAQDKGTGTKAEEIDVQVKKIEELKVAAENAKTSLIEMARENAAPPVDSWEQLVKELDKFEGSAESAARLKDALRNMNQSSIDTISSSIKSFQDKADDYSKRADQSAEYKEQVDKLKGAISELRAEQAKLSTTEGISETQQKRIDDLTDSCKNYISTIQHMKSSEKGSSESSRMKQYDKIAEYMKKNTRMSKQFREELEALQRQLMSGDPSVNVEKINTEFIKIKDRIHAAKQEGKSFIDIFKTKIIHGFAAKLAMYYLSFYDFIRYARNAVNAVVELDTALVDLKKTTTMTNVQLEDFYYTSNDIAKQMGVTTAEIIEQASAWSRLGFSSNEAAAQMAQLSSQFASISPGMDVDTATDGILSSMKAFGIEVQDVEREIMDNINRIGNTAGTSNAEIVDMLSRSSAAMAVANNTIEETIALETAAVEITRNAESTGTAFKTLSMRIRGYDEETEELSDDLKNISGDIADLTKTAKTPGGISLFTDDTKETYKSTYQILKEISEIYNDLSDKNRAELLEKLAGKRGGQVVASLLTNFSAAEKAINEMENAAGAADAEMSIVEQSLTFKINALKQTWVGTAQSILDRSDFGKVIDSLTKLSEAIGWVIDKAGMLGTIGLGAGLVAGIKNAG